MYITLFIGDNIIIENANNKVVFEDYDFINTKAIHDNMGGDEYGIKCWKRISDMTDNEDIRITNPQVITNGLEAGDICQGKIGD